MKIFDKLSQIFFIITHESRAIDISYTVLLVLMGGIFVYGLLYSYIYASSIMTDVSVAVVDNSHGNLSRQYICWLNTTPQVAVYVQAMDYQEAHEWMKEDKMQGILYILHNFKTRVFQGREVVLSLYTITDALLYFEALQEVTLRVYLALNDTHRTNGAVFPPPQGLLAIMIAEPVNIAGTTFYNHAEGYGSYLTPAVITVIIFQALLMVVGMLTGDGYQHRAAEPLLPGFRTTGKNGFWGAATRLMARKIFVYYGLYAIFSMFLLGLLPHFLSIPNVGNGSYIITMMMPYLTTTSFFGLAVSRLSTDSGAPLLMIAFSSAELTFLSGVPYPLELIPWYQRMMCYTIPAISTTLVFVRLSSMGADMADIQPEYATLWIQVVVYFGLSVQIHKKKLEA